MKSEYPHTAYGTIIGSGTGSSGSVVKAAPPASRRMPPAENSRGDNLALGKIVPDGVNVLPAMRVADEMRLRYRHHIEECKTLGYISEDEYKARVSAIDGTETAQALAVLIADLPPLPDPEQARRDAEAEAEKKAKADREAKERGSIKWKLGNITSFRVTAQILGIIVSLLTAIIPICVLASLPHAGLLVWALGMPCTIIGTVSFFTLVINLIMFLDR